jgi:hypothetical protein
MLEASFTYKKNSPQFYSFGMGEASLNLSTTCKDVDLEEYESISHLMRPFMVYGVIICTFAPLPQKLPLAFAIMKYVHTLHEHLRTHTWESVQKFHIVFHQKRTSRGVYEPSGRSTPDHGLEMAQLFKCMPPIMPAPRNEHRQQGPRSAQPTAAARATRSATTTTKTPAPTRPAATITPARYARDLIQPHNAAKRKARHSASAYPGGNRDLQGP